jgi:hypothetical protein
MQRLETLVSDISRGSASVRRNKRECQTITDIARELLPKLRLFLDTPACGREYEVDSILEETRKLLSSAQQLLTACAEVNAGEGKAGRLPAISPSISDVVETRLLPQRLSSISKQLRQLAISLTKICNIGHRRAGSESRCTSTESFIAGHPALTDTDNAGTERNVTIVQGVNQFSLKEAQCSTAQSWVEKQVQRLSSKESAERREQAVTAIRSHIVRADGAAYTDRLVRYGAVPSLVHLLGCGSDTAKEHAAAILWHCARSEPHRSTVVASDAVPRLAGLLTHPCSAVREQAAGALSALAWASSGRRAIVAANAVPVLAQMLKLGSPVAVEHAAAAMWALTSERQIQAAVVAAEPVEKLVALLYTGTASAAENAAAALWNLARFSESQPAVVAAGGVPELVEVLSAGTGTARERAAGALAHIATSNAHTCAVAEAGAALPAVQMLLHGSDLAQRNASKLLSGLARVDAALRMVVAVDAIPALVQLLQCGSSVAQEEAAGALLQCVRTGELERAVAAAGAVSPLVELLQSHRAVTVFRAAALVRAMTTHADLVLPLREVDGVRSLVGVLNQHEPGVAAVTEAVAALRNLVTDAECAAVMVDAGAVPLLVRLLRDDCTPAVVEPAAAVLCGLTEYPVLSEPLLQGDAVPALVQLLHRATDSQSEDGTMQVMRATWCLMQSNSNAHSAVATGGAIPFVVKAVGVAACDVYAVEALLMLAHYPDYRQTIVGAGACDAYVRLLGGRGTNYLQRVVAETLWELALDGTRTRSRIVESGLTPMLVAMLSECTDAGRYLIAGALWNVAADCDGREVIVAAGGIPALVQLLPPERGTAHAMAAATLWNLSADPVNQQLIAASGAVPLLTFLLEVGAGEVKGYACAALRNLALRRSNRRLIVEAGAVPLLLAQVIAPPAHATRLSAVSALWYLSLSSRHVQVVKALGAAPVLLQLLRLGDEVLQEECLGALSALGAAPSALLEAGGRAVLLRLLARDDTQCDQRALLVLLSLGTEMGITV